MDVTIGDNTCEKNLQTSEIGSSLTKAHIESLQAPYVGMEFKTIEEAKTYYQEYGRQNGFWVRTRTTAKSRARINEVTFVILVCSQEGKPEKKLAMQQIGEGKYEKGSGPRKVRSCSTIRSGCKAYMRILNEIDRGCWIVTGFEDAHNHKFISPLKRIKMKSNRNMPKSAKDLTEAFRGENLKVGKVASILKGDEIGFTDRDCYNHLRSLRHKELEFGDAQSVLLYFQKKQAENPQFYYAIQCDGDGRAINFFWVDARSRMAYHSFGDVVTFDTTYRTNKYDMPFAPFTGVNHHSQSIQFGCALLQDETELTFTWLFQTWLDTMGGHTMGGHHPSCIITDQDLAMAAAISRVLPKTHHCLCLWHIMKKFAEKLSHVYFKRSKFKKDLKSCIRHTYRVEDFEHKWKILIEEYHLESNTWLQGLYSIRNSWVPTYNRGLFFAGMNTTGRSEGVNSFFDNFVTPRTSLKEFVVKYDQALASIIRKENDEDFQSEHKCRILNDDAFLLKHASKVYTRNIFEKFKREWNKVKDYKIDEVDHDNGKYIVGHKVEVLDKFLVNFEKKNQEGNCECQLFEFAGYLCAHILKVFVREDIDEIPSHFIKQRWVQGANNFRSMDSESLVIGDDNHDPKVLRLSHLCRKATQLANYAAESNEGYQLFLKTIEEVTDKICKMNKPVGSSSFASQTSQENICHDNFSQFVILDPNVAQTKGRKRDGKDKEKNQETGRFKCGIELSQQKKRKCNWCKGRGHDKRICPIRLNENTEKQTYTS